MMIRVARGLSAKQTPALHDLRCEQAYVTQYVAESSARNVLSGPYSLTWETQFTAGETGRLHSTGPQKLTQLAEYPWSVFDLPEMQAAMARAGVDRNFVVRIWEQNGPEQQLFARGERYDEEAHLASVAGRLASAPTAVEARQWGKVKVLYR